MRTNKKLYNFKVKHKRKKRTRSTVIWWRKVSSLYTKIQRRNYRSKAKSILRKIESEQTIEFSIPKKTMWWDS